MKQQHCGYPSSFHPPPSFSLSHSWGWCSTLPWLPLHLEEVPSGQCGLYHPVRYWPVVYDSTSYTFSLYPSHTDFFPLNWGNFHQLLLLSRMMSQVSPWLHYVIHYTQCIAPRAVIFLICLSKIDTHPILYHGIHFLHTYTHHRQMYVYSLTTLLILDRDQQTIVHWANCSRGFELSLVFTFLNFFKWL